MVYYTKIQASFLGRAYFRSHIDFTGQVLTKTNLWIAISQKPRGGLQNGFKSGISTELLADHLCEYLYRREVRFYGEDSSTIIATLETTHK
ncbi:hypothetical protein J6590_101358 [Homalodisca vitripennis]|nr:hypothetical protein J6590_101358 [Homalodisca vitripennis]